MPSAFSVEFVRSNPKWIMYLATFSLALCFLAAPFATKAQEAVKPVAPFRIPDEKDIPGGPLGEAIRYGEQVLTRTQVYAKRYIGNGLNCTSCHLNGGKTPYASPWVGIWGVFPEYRSRNATRK